MTDATMTPELLPDELIAVPRQLLASAAYCARKHAGADSATYKQLSAASLSKPTPEPDVAALVEALRRISRLTPAAANADSALDLYASVAAIADTALARWDARAFKDQQPGASS